MAGTPCSTAGTTGGVPVGGQRRHLRSGSWAYPDQALASLRRGIAFANDLGHAPSVAHALWLAGFVHMMRRDAAGGSRDRRTTGDSGQRSMTSRSTGWRAACCALGARPARGRKKKGSRDARSDGRLQVAGRRDGGPFLVSLPTANGAPAISTEPRRPWCSPGGRHASRRKAVDRRRPALQRRSGGEPPGADLAAAERLYAEALAIAHRLGAKSLELRAAKGLGGFGGDRAGRQACDLFAPVLAGSPKGSTHPT